MRGRIRTVKPEALTDEELWDLEQDTGLPIFRAFVGLWTQADREGRFEWRPRALKAAILPYWEGDMARVLDALATRGFIRKYASDGRDFGLVRTFKRHQVVNNREAASDLPEPPDSSMEPDTPRREARAPDACLTPLVHAHGERKGREGKGREGKGASREARDGPLAQLDSLRESAHRAAYRRWCELYAERLAVPAPPAHLEALKPLAVWVAEHCLVSDQGLDPAEVATRVVEGFFASRRDMKHPRPDWLCENPPKYLGIEAVVTDKREAARQSESELEKQRYLEAQREAVPMPPEFAAAMVAFSRGVSLPSDDSEQRKRELEAQAEQLRVARATEAAE